MTRRRRPHRLAGLALAAIALPLMGQSECEQVPEPIEPTPIANYVVLGNGWNADLATPDEVAYAASALAGVQDFREGSGRALRAAGLRWVLKYRHGVGATPNASATERKEIYRKVRGWTLQYRKDIRMRRVGGGVMTHDVSGVELVDVVTEENREIFRQILRESLVPFLTGPDAFSGVFLDVAGPHNPDAYRGQVPDPPGGYSRVEEQAGWLHVYRGLAEDFPDKAIFINAHQPWEPREPIDLTGMELARQAGVGIMTEARMLSVGNVSGWTDETIRDVDRLLDEGVPVIVLHSVDRSNPTLAAQRYWGTAVFLLAAGSSPMAALGFDGVSDVNGLPRFPEMRFPGLGAEVGDLNRYLGDRIYERRFTGGRVVAHVRAGRPAATYLVPPGMQRLVLVGGGSYPAYGELRWEDIAPGPITLEAPARDMPASSALILRYTPSSAR